MFGNKNQGDGKAGQAWDAAAMADASVPTLAVVGHPNKGKSSIVATLAQTASIAIADESGTTKQAGVYPVHADGQRLYQLVDTPGFQRPRKALAWMLERSPTAEQRPQAVRDFVAAFGKDKDAFPDECELLKPIVAGAGIVYVVDGSVPYGPAYEPEMEILRASGQPRMALINPIGPADHKQAWADALGQYFSVVRVFDAHTAAFDKQVALLKAFAELHEAWRGPMQRAVDAMQRNRQSQINQAMAAVAGLLVGAVTHQVARDTPWDTDPGPTTQTLVNRYQRDLRNMESQARANVAAAFGHGGLHANEGALEALETDLFSEASRRLFGLTRSQAAWAGAAAGASGGVVADLALGGASLGLVAGLSAVAGGAAAWMGFDRLARVKVLKLRELGVRRVVVGPVRGPQLPTMLLARAWQHARLVAERTHAKQSPLDLTEQMQAPDAVLKAVLSVLKPLFGKSPDPALAQAVEGDLAIVLSQQWLSD